ncbi:uncharacterized protein LOC126457457 [Schistocerca serialis cubense]|uniref:uncharacterized protein LOC126457457 n=2 Tax=Schistocerca TaxID=7008 RepID=UPI00214E3286|nr:uncharacterized protein LOC126457457 [Schistocerca serialis cubense]
MSLNAAFRVSIKVMQLMLCCVCIALVVYTIPGNFSESVLQYITYGGYIIIVIGAIVGLATRDPIPKKVELVFLLTAVVLQVAAGSCCIHHARRRTSWPAHYSNGRDVSYACGSLAIINAGFFLLDAVLAVFEDEEYRVASQRG